MSNATPLQPQKLHDELVRKASETIFRKYKVVVNLTDYKIIQIDDIYPDLVAYDVLSIKPFIASDTPSVIGEVEVENTLTDAMVAKWKKMADLNIDKLMLIVPEQLKDEAIARLQGMGNKIELHTYDDHMYIA